MGFTWRKKYFPLLTLGSLTEALQIRLAKDSLTREKKQEFMNMLIVHSHRSTKRKITQKRRSVAPHSSTLAWKIPWTEGPGGLQSMGSLGVGHDWATLTVHFHAVEKAMATHSSVLAWRIPGTGEPGGLPSMGSHRVRHDWSDLAAAAAAVI